MKKKRFNKKERLAIYKELLADVYNPVEIGIRPFNSYYLCWKFYIKLVGFEQFRKESHFGKTGLVLREFPEFAKVFAGYESIVFSDNTQREECLKTVIKSMKKIKLKQLENWLGEYSAESLKADILSYE